MERKLCRRVGGRLREARERKGLSVKRVAQAVGINPTYIHCAESGRQFLSFHRMVLAAKILGVSLDALVEDE